MLVSALSYMPKSAVGGSDSCQPAWGTRTGGSKGSGATVKALGRMADSLGDVAESLTAPITIAVPDAVQEKQKIDLEAARAKLEVARGEQMQKLMEEYQARSADVDTSQDAFLVGIAKKRIAKIKIAMQDLADGE
mgnify:CR=1 FL=1